MWVRTELKTHVALPKESNQLNSCAAAHGTQQNTFHHAGSKLGQEQAAARLFDGEQCGRILGAKFALHISIKKREI